MKGGLKFIFEERRTLFKNKIKYPGAFRKVIELKLFFIEGISIQFICDGMKNISCEFLLVTKSCLLFLFQASASSRFRAKT